MTDMPSIREKVTRTIQVAIPLPVDRKTFYLWEHIVEQEFIKRVNRKPEYDDDFVITSDGEHLIASFDITNVGRDEAGTR